MNGTFSAQAVTLGTLFSDGAIYAMPGFQRPYAWTLAEVSRLLDEILLEITAPDQSADAGSDPTLTDPTQTGGQAGDGVLFLGTIVLIETGVSIKEAGQTRTGDLATRLFDVVDGQQRLVTVTLAFAALRDLARGHGLEELAGRLDGYIAIDDSGAPAGRRYRIALRERDAAVLVAYAQQMDGCLAEADPQEFEGAQRNLVRNRNSIYQELKALEPALLPRLAQVLESRCRVVVIRTDDIDNAFRIFSVVNQAGKTLSRNDLLKAELISALPAAEQPRYVALWEQAEAACKEDFEQLFSHIRTAWGSGRAQVITEIRRLAAEAGGAQAFLDNRVLPMARVYAGLTGRPGAPAILTAPALRTVRYLERLGHSDWVPPALLWAHERKADLDEIATLLAALDRFAHGHLLLGFGRDRRQARYNAIIRAMHGGRSPLPPPAIGQLQSLQTQDPRGTLWLGAEDQRNILYNAANDLYGRSTTSCKLLLLRLNDALTPSAINSGGSLVDPRLVSVEHVLPQRIGKSSQWHRLFSDGALAHYAGSLGNLILVTPETNRRARNSEFDLKRVEYASDPLMPDLALNQGVLETTEFGPAQIEAREQRLLEAMRSLWSLNGPVDRQWTA